MRYLLLLLCALSAPAMWAGTAYTSIGAGNWSDHTKWSPDPGAGNHPCQGTNSGDTFTLNTAMTVDVGIDCGTSGVAGTVDGTVDATSTNTGALTIGSAITMKMRGGIQLKNSVLTIRDDSVLEFDPSLAGSPSTANYSIVMGTASSQNNVAVVSANTSGAHPFIFRTNATAGNAPFSFSATSGRVAFYNLAFGTIQRCGTTSIDCLQIAYGGLASKIQTFTSVTCDTCSGNTAMFSFVDSPVSSSGFTLSRVRTINTAAPTTTHALYLNTSGSAHTATRTVDLSSFDTLTYISGNGNVWTRNVFNNWAITGSSIVDWGQFGEATPGDGMGNFIHCTNFSSCGILNGPFNGNYLIIDSPGTSLVAGTATSASNSSPSAFLTDSTQSWTANAYRACADGQACGFFVVITGGTGVGQYRSIYANSATVLSLNYPWDTIPDNTSAYAIVAAMANPHVLGGGTDYFSATEPFTDNFIESDITDNNGNLISNPSAAALVTSVVTSNIFTCNASGDGSAANLVSTSNQTKNFTVEHNTFCVGGQAAINTDEPAPTPTGSILSFKNNIVFAKAAWTSIFVLTGSFNTNPSGDGPYAIGDVNNGPCGSMTLNIITAANASNNAIYGNKSGCATNGFNINLSGTPNAVGAVTSDASFVDQTRKLGPWAYLRGYSTSLNPLQRITDGLAAIQTDPARIADLYTWVRGGFAPQNSAYHNTASDGTDIGAIPFLPPVVTNVIMGGSVKVGGSVVVQ